jgi:hypothetical protein
VAIRILWGFPVAAQAALISPSRPLVTTNRIVTRTVASLIIRFLLFDPFLISVSYLRFGGLLQKKIFFPGEEPGCPALHDQVV